MIDLLTEYDNQNLTGDLALAEGALAQDDGLVTAIIISLFSNRRARADDQLPAGGNDRQGWWGDLLPPVAGDQIGSRLWLLRREKTTPQTLNRAREYAQEALQWLVDDGQVSQVEVETEETRRGVLGMLIKVILLDGSQLEAVLNVDLNS